MGKDRNAANREDSTEALSPSGSPVLRLRDCELSVEEGPDKGRSFAPGMAEVRVGKAPENDVVLTDPAISRCHFVIEDRPDGYLLRDLGSRNGTKVNGLAVKEVYLGTGVTISIGRTVLRFRPREHTTAIGPSTSFRCDELLGNNLRMRELFGFIERVGPTNLPVLILGETGTGKELIAQAVHRASPRREAPFVVFDCGACEPSLVGAALFGHARGAFTGAIEARKGAFPSAEGGTVFIDEVGELPLELQPKLLRVLEKREVQPLGSDTPVLSNVRIVAATHRDLRAAVQAGKFRQDLYYRLAGVVLGVPPLRERPEDLPMLAEHFLQAVRPGAKLSAAARARMATHSWPGNVRELRAAIERAAVLARGDTLGEADLMLEPPAGEPARESPATSAPVAALADAERTTIEAVLNKTAWNRGKAAQILGISPKTLREKIARYGIGPR